MYANKRTVGILFAIVGFLVAGLRMERLIREVETLYWKDATAEIDSANFSFQQKLDSHNRVIYVYTANIQYRYTVRGHECVGTNYDLGGPLVTGNKVKFDGLKDQINKSKKITVYYNPEKYTQSLIDRGISESTWVALTFSIFLLILGTLTVTRRNVMQ